MKKRTSGKLPLVNVINKRKHIKHMKKYIKKPVEIEAVQWTGLNPTEIKEFAGDNVGIEYYDAAYEAGAGPMTATVTIHTLEGDMKANHGDYIIKGVKGEFYPCRQDIFEQTYEEVV